MHAPDLHGLPRAGFGDREDLVVQQEAINADDLARFRAGDREAVAKLYARVIPLVRHTVSRLTRQDPSHEDVDEIVSSIMQALIQRVDASPPEPVSFEAWIARVATNKAIEYSRWRQKQARAIDRAEDELAQRVRLPGTEVPEYRELADRLDVALQQLPVNERQVILLHIEGMSMREVSEVLGLSASTTYHLYSRALRKLRELFPVDK